MQFTFKKFNVFRSAFLPTSIPFDADSTIQMSAADNLLYLWAKCKNFVFIWLFFTHNENVLENGGLTFTGGNFW